MLQELSLPHDMRFTTRFLYLGIFSTEILSLKHIILLGSPLEESKESGKP